ncbi:uncharacterized protein LOC109854515 isoform X2 [Pseudomyrmex gracilis]|uniref:uncharacterized protein LOC109854515 isoform X2 n=1 Tax=Pseudomyrmex gracilis TaxID=219809 RepID=UPI0009957579|nr:uncharacterized protein LOC109854515 isoform X2 [Pseudomyrmex gracilis]
MSFSFERHCVCDYPRESFSSSGCGLISDNALLKKDSIIKMLRGATGVLFILVIAESVSQITQESKTIKRNEDVILTISDDQKRQYLRQNITSDVYKYGYDVDSNGQFHHEIRGPDGITYGCYGYVDSFHRLRTTFYLSDGWGYRVVNAGKDVELFLNEHKHHVEGDKHDHHGVVTPWEKLHFPAMCAEYTHDTVSASKISSAGTPIEKGSFIDASSNRPPNKPALDGKPGLHDILETSRTPTGYPRNLPGISRLLSRPEQPRTFSVSETPNSPGTSVYAKQFDSLGTLDTSRLLQGKLGPSDISETFGAPETSGSLAYHGESSSSKISDTPDVSELSPYPGQHGISGTLGFLGTSRRPVMPAQSGQPGIPETFSIPVTSAKSKLLSHLQYSGTTGISDTPEIVGISRSQAYHKQSGSLEKSKKLGTPETFDIPGILVTSGLSDTSKISDISGTARISGSLVYPKRPNSLNITDTSGLSSHSGQSGASRTLAGQVPSRRLPTYSRQPGTAKALNISINSATSRLPSYLEYFNTSGTPKSSDIPEASLTPFRQPDISRISSDSSTSGLLPRQRQPGKTSHSKTSSIPKTSDVLNYSAQTFITRAPDIPGIPSTSDELLLHSGQFGTLNTVGSSVYFKQPGDPGILDILSTPGLSSHQNQSGTLGTSRRPESPVEQSGVSEISDTFGRTGLSFLQEQSGTLSASKKPGGLVYFKQSSVSEISDTSNRSGLSSYQEQSRTSGTPKLSGSSVYFKQPSVSGIPDTSGTLGSFHLEQSSLSDTSGIPDSRKISGQSVLPAYSEQQGTLKSSFNNNGNISGSISYREHSDAPGTPRKLETLAYSKTLLDKSVISSKHGRIGNSKRPVEFKGSSEIIEGVGEIDGVNRDGDVGLDGPNGPWPTGSPGPNGPWPGDPDYLSGIEPTRKHPQIESIKQHSKTFPLDTDNYKSVTQYYFKNKTEPLYKNYENIKLNFSHSTNASVPLYTKQTKPQYKIESTSSIYEKEDTYDADEINSLLQRGSTSPLLKNNVKSHKNPNFVKQLPQTYNHVSRIESHRTETPPEQDSEQLSVYDRSQYQKSVFYPTHKSQFSKDRYNKLGRQESSFNTRGQYNNSGTDSKSVSSFQSDGSSTGMEKQVNSGLEQSFQANPGLDAIGIHPPDFINVKPFPLPIGPDPQACPCYLVGPNNNTNVATRPTSTSVIGQIGFIPVIFVPYCPGDETDRKMKAIFPSAAPVPYACDACGAQDSALGIKPLDISQLGNINYLKELLNQANLGFLNVPVKTSANRRRSGTKDSVRNA